MPWPLSQDYNEAIQSPAANFADPDLRRGEAATNALGLPIPCSGNFADVYQVRCPDGSRWAVKCFTREVRGLRDRYHAVSAHLGQARLPFTVDFQYLEQGIRVAGRWYPVVKMNWVEGLTLNAFVRDSLEKQARLEALGRIWLRMGKRLREAGIGHCDLQHGNVLLVPDSGAQSLSVKLIDYDGMWVPALANNPSGEVGHPAYQHPQRLRESTYSREADRFPLLVVYTAIRCLLVGGRGLWDRFDTGDNLLFRREDFEAPARSPLFAELLRSNQPELRRLAGTLVDAARMPLDQTPLLEELVTDGPTLPPMTAAKAQVPAPAAPTEVGGPIISPMTVGRVGAGSPANGRGKPRVALVGAAVLGLVGLGIGVLAFVGSREKPAGTPGPVAKGKAGPETAKDIQPITKPGGDARPKVETKPETAKDIKPITKPDGDTPPKVDSKPDTKPETPKERKGAKAGAITYDANADFEAGWKAGENPNGVWRYGWTKGLRGPLTLFTRRHVPPSLNNLQHMWDAPKNSVGFTPSVARNSGDKFDNGNVTFQVGALILHPCGPSGRDYARVIFTAPAAGSYSLTGDIFAQQNNINVDVHVLVKGVSVFNSTITSNGISRPFKGVFELSARDTIDFAVGPNGNFVPHAGNTGWCPTSIERPAGLLYNSGSGSATPWPPGTTPPWTT